jgi:hypothetical protein
MDRRQDAPDLRSLAGGIRAMEVDQKSSGGPAAVDDNPLPTMAAGIAPGERRRRVYLCR